MQHSLTNQTRGQEEGISPRKVPNKCNCSCTKKIRKESQNSHAKHLSLNLELSLVDISYIDMHSTFQVEGTRRCQACTGKVILFYGSVTPWCARATIYEPAKQWNVECSMEFGICSFNSVLKSPKEKLQECRMPGSKFSAGLIKSVPILLGVTVSQKDSFFSRRFVFYNDLWLLLVQVSTNKTWWTPLVTKKEFQNAMTQWFSKIGIS